MRIYRDTRFSADKRPYKTNVAMMFVPAGKKMMASLGFGLQITPGHAELVAGQFAFLPEQLELYRTAVLAEAPGRALEKAVAAVRAAGTYSLGEPDLKGVPRGFDWDHPRSDWLRHKGLPVFAPKIEPAVAQTPALVDVIMIHFRAMSPIWRWLQENVASGP